MTTIHYFVISPPGLGASLTILGGPLRVEGTDVVLCSPTGQPLFRVAQQLVREITRAELAQRLVEEQRQAIAEGSRR
jgi:hypothetical protein